MLPTGNIAESAELCEKRVTECCTVVQSTAKAMGAVPIQDNDFSKLRMNWRTPKAGVTGSNPVGRASKQKGVPAGPLFCLLGVSRPRKRALFDKTRQRFGHAKRAPKV